MNIYCIAIAVYLAVINIVAFAMYGIDKRKAKTGAWRTSEAALLGAAAIGGAVGAWIAMFFFRHKTKHLKFKYGVPAILTVHFLIAGALIYHYYL